MDKSNTSDTERKELRILVEDIKSKAGCVLVLGPRSRFEPMILTGVRSMKF